MPPTDHVGRELLSRAHSPDSSARIFEEKVQLRPLLLKASEPSTTTPDARTRRRNTRLAAISKRKKTLKPKPLSAREKRAIGVHDIPKEERKYEIYVPLHRLWLGYMHEILGVSANVFKEASVGSASILTSADYHGAILEVVRSRCPSRVGIQGIVVRDTKFTFEIVTPNNELKIVPKEHTVFGFRVPVHSLGEQDTRVSNNLKDEPLSQRYASFEIHGDQFQHRAVDRANKKFKPHWLPNI